MGDFGGVAQVEDLEFLTDELIESAILLEQVLVVQTGNKEDIADLVPHQLLKILDAGVRDLVDAEPGAGRHAVTVGARKCESEGKIRQKPLTRKPEHIDFVQNGGYFEMIDLP